MLLLRSDAYVHHFADPAAVRTLFCQRSRHSLLSAAAGEENDQQTGTDTVDDAAGKKG